MIKRSKSEQKAYLDGCMMVARTIKNYLTHDGKRVLKWLLMAVKNTVTESEDNDADNRS